jgi:hypothetical protein
MMQEHREQAQKAEDSWKCTSAHFEECFEFE